MFNIVYNGYIDFFKIAFCIYFKVLLHKKWITRYKIYPEEDSRIDFTLNVIKIPGFGDTGGIKEDNAILHQIQNLLLASDEQSALYLDVICFVVKALDTRLTSCQKYMFHSVMSLFGNDLETNICTLITFCDGAKPPVLASLKELELPFGQSFTFNNSALYAENNVDNNNTLSSMFWEMGYKSYEHFFQFNWVVARKSNIQTKNVLTEREELKKIIENRKPLFTAGLAKLSELKKQLDIFLEHERTMERNKKFEYTVNETTGLEMIDLPRGQHVTNCLVCNFTCHEKCTITLDENKKKCDAIDSNGYCTVCPRNCGWSEHRNTPYIFRYVTKPVTKTYTEMEKRYEEATGKTCVQTKHIKTLFSDVNALSENLSSMIHEMNRCKTRLKEITLISGPLSDVKYIDLKILFEERKKQPGYLNRIKMLEEIKRTSLIVQDFDTLSKQLKDEKKSIKSIMTRFFEKGYKG